jgi:four helix bundle protein
MNELELRCLRFAKGVRDYCRDIKHDDINLVYIRQLIRSSSSIGANYIEANEKLGKQDLLMRLRIARKEAKETMYWLRLVSGNDEQREQWHIEADEIRKILSAIINKLQE